MIISLCITSGFEKDKKATYICPGAERRDEGKSILKKQDFHVFDRPPDPASS